MITQLSSPSVCVIDDEEQDYRPILAALNGLYVSCIHILGNDIENLPQQPFKTLQLVFLDLHLTGAFGKGAASHTANVFRKVVSADSAPIVVVIWSKYAQDKVAEDGVPVDDQETEADHFKKTLLGAEPKFEGRLIFAEMAKPKVADRDGAWAESLKGGIDAALRDQSAVDLLWTWDSLVKASCVAVSGSLTSVAAEHSGSQLKDSLKATLQRLTKAQGENDLSPATAPRHLVTVLAELLADQLDYPDGLGTLAAHGVWLAAPAGAVGGGFAARMNGLLLTAGVPDGGVAFAPGTVYRLRHTQAFASAFGKECASLVELLCNDGPNSDKRVEWRAAVVPVLVEVSPVCDVAQNYRATASLIAGLIVPEARKGQIRSGESFARLPAFQLRWPAEHFAAQDSILVFCHRYKAALPAAAVPGWLVPWFRLRELPTASLRNAQAGHGSRVGYVSVSD